MRRCAFLTMDNPAGFVFDDELAVDPLRTLGWEVSFISWTDPAVQWDLFDVVIPRTTWDYHHHLPRFLSVLERIDRSRALLANSLPLMRWNAHKSYLIDLSRRGVRIVPTIHGKSLNAESLTTIKEQLGTDSLVVKPLVGANADFTFPLHPGSSREHYNAAYVHFTDREFLAQEFIANVTEEGEYSLFYFNGRHSHSILKTPRKGDFRVQEEHGGIIAAVKAEQRLLDTGQTALRALPEEPLYARADFVRDAEGHFCLMELELIEPALYFRMDPDAAGRFARAVTEWMATHERRP